MKKLNIVIILFTLLCSACSKKFNDMNTDPTQFTDATPEAALQGAFKRLNDFMANNNTNRWWDIANNINAGSRYNVDDAGLWQALYVNVLGPVYQVKKKYADDPNFNNRVQIARIWEAYTYSILAGNFGPVPRSQALDPTILSDIKYDSEDSVYTYVLNTLKEAAAKIDVTKTQDRLTYDAIYGSGTNSLVNWKKFANTLRLKIALRVTRNLGDVAKQHIQEVMADEANMISAETETTKMAYENVINNENPYYIRFVRLSYTQDPPSVMDILFIYFRAYQDPRLDAYYDSVPAVADRYLLRDTLTSTADDSLRVVDYRIPHLPRPKSTAKLPGWTPVLVGNDPMGSAGIKNYSRLKGYGWGTNNQAQPAGLFAADRPFIILSYAESMFLRAEAAALGLGGSKTAEQYYNAGIDANCSYWKVSNAARDAYKQRNGIKFGTAGVTPMSDYVSMLNVNLPADNLTKIYLQEFINYFPDQAFDAWTLQRRTRSINETPHTNPNNGVVNVPYMEIPMRGVYPTTNVQLNPTGYNDALVQLNAGANELYPYIPLRFEIPYTVPDWNSKPAVYNMNFVQKWYGNTIQDLKAAGVAYTVVLTFKL